LAPCKENLNPNTSEAPIFWKKNIALDWRFLIFKNKITLPEDPFPHTPQKKKQGVCHNVALPFTLKSIFRQKKNYGNSNISPCKNIIFKTIL